MDHVCEHLQSELVDLESCGWSQKLPTEMNLKSVQIFFFEAPLLLGDFCDFLK